MVRPHHVVSVKLQMMFPNWMVVDNYAHSGLGKIWIVLVLRSGI